MLDELSEGWRAETLIHSDIKWDNCIVLAPSRSSRRTTLKIIDWEFAAVGDPLWDVGAVFSNYLSFWLFSIPLTGGDVPGRFLDLARFPLEKMQPALRAFWSAYLRQLEPDTEEADEWLLRAARYAAARLVQTAFGQLQTSVHLAGNLACLLQLSMNIMQRPQEAVVQLLGIPLRQLRVV
jgi:thiamine kinase-like enzyme